MHNAIAFLIVRVCGVALLFVNNVILARFLGAHDFGIYSFALSWLSLLSIFSSLGFGRLLMRSTAIYRVQKNWGELSGLLRFSTQVTLFVSFGLSVLLYILFEQQILGELEADTRLTLQASLICLPFWTFAILRQGALKGLNKVVIGESIESFVQPLFFLVVLMAVYFFTKITLTSVSAMLITVLAFINSACVGAYAIHKILPKEILNTKAKYRLKLWMTSGLYFMLISGLDVINLRADTIILGFTRGVSQVGVYNVVARGADVLSLVAIAMNATAAPVIASLYASNQKPQLQKTISKNVKITFYASLPIAIILGALSNVYLSMFGEEFLIGREALTILIISKVLSASLGMGSLVLMMTKYEHKALVGVSIGVLFSILFNFIFSKVYGMNGSALASMLGQLVVSAVLAFMAYRYLGINTTIYPIRSREHVQV